MLRGKNESLSVLFKFAFLFKAYIPDEHGQSLSPTTPTNATVRLRLHNSKVFYTIVENTFKRINLNILFSIKNVY